MGQVVIGVSRHKPAFGAWKPSQVSVLCHAIVVCTLLVHAMATCEPLDILPKKRVPANAAHLTDRLGGCHGVDERQAPGRTGLQMDGRDI